MPEPLVTFENVSVVYPNGYHALKNVSIAFNPGEFVVVVGLSGAGKSTLIRCVNRLVEPSSGSLTVAGTQIAGKVSDSDLRKVRSQVGMIFQNYNLVRRSSVLRNVLTGRLAHLPTWRTLLGAFPKSDIELAYRNLERVGMADRMYNRADQLSGGQQQRVAIARALTQGPSVLLADEPVASLDPPTAHQVMRDLRDLSREHNLLTLINLHFVDMAMEYADRVVGLRAGEIVFDGPTTGMTEETFEQIYNRRIRPDDMRGVHEDDTPPVSTSSSAVPASPVTDVTETPDPTSVAPEAAETPQPDHPDEVDSILSALEQRISNSSQSKPTEASEGGR